MIIKKSDWKQEDIAILEGLAGRGDVDARTRERIELEIRKMKSGMKERSAKLRWQLFPIGSRTSAGMWKGRLKG